MTTYPALISLAILLIGIVIHLVRRDRRERDLERRGLVRSVAKLDFENTQLQAQIRNAHRDGANHFKTSE